MTDASHRCLPYYYAPVSDAMAAGEFPPVWALANIIANDVNALAKYQSIRSQIPNISPNGYQPQSIGGVWTNFNYPSDDPNCWWTFSHCTSPKIAGLPPDLTAVPEPDTLGYGFDDGPSCSHDVFYDYLQGNDQKATMFYVGSNVAIWPLEAQRGRDDGHEIYTWSHRYLTALTNEEVFAELYYSKLLLPRSLIVHAFVALEMIKLVIGVTPTCWRPPYGDVDDRVRSIAHALGLRNIIWDYDSSDWRAGIGGYTDANVDANYEDLIAHAQDGTFSTRGAILLAHELDNDTMSEAIKFYNPLRAVFKHLVPIGVATNVSKLYIENEYLLPTFDQYISGTRMLIGSLASPTNSSYQPSFTGSSVQSRSAESSAQATSAGRSASWGTSGSKPSLALVVLVVLSAFSGLLR